MSIYTAINALKAELPIRSLSHAELFLGSLPFVIQQKLIAAIYIGRDHIHADNWNQDVFLSASFIDHIHQNDYARIIYEKSNALMSYLNSVERCAINSKFDLNQL